MKKLVSGLLALILILSLAGCGKSENSAALPENSSAPLPEISSAVPASAPASEAAVTPPESSVPPESGSASLPDYSGERYRRWLYAAGEDTLSPLADGQIAPVYAQEAVSPDGNLRLLCAGYGGGNFRVAAQLVLYNAAEKRFTNLFDPEASDGLFLTGGEFRFLDDQRLYNTRLGRRDGRVCILTYDAADMAETPLPILLPQGVPGGNIGGKHNIDRVQWLPESGRFLVCFQNTGLPDMTFASCRAFYDAAGNLLETLPMAQGFVHAADFDGLWYRTDALRDAADRIQSYTLREYDPAADSERTLLTLPNPVQGEAHYGDGLYLNDVQNGRALCTVSENENWSLFVLDLASRETLLRLEPEQYLDGEAQGFLWRSCLTGSAVYFTLLAESKPGENRSLLWRQSLTEEADRTLLLSCPEADAPELLAALPDGGALLLFSQPPETAG